MKIGSNKDLKQNWIMLWRYNKDTQNQNWIKSKSKSKIKSCCKDRTKIQQNHAVNIAQISNIKLLSVIQFYV